METSGQTVVARGETYPFAASLSIFRMHMGRKEVYGPHSRVSVYRFCFYEAIGSTLGDRVSPWKCGEISHFGAALWPRRYYWNLSLCI